MAEFEATFETWWANYLDEHPQELLALNPENFDDIFTSLDFKALGGLTAKFVEPEDIFVYEPDGPDDPVGRTVLKSDIVQLRDSGNLICLAPMDAPFVVTRTSWLLEAAGRQHIRGYAIKQLNVRNRTAPTHNRDEIWLVRAGHIHFRRPIQG